MQKAAILRFLLVYLFIGLLGMGLLVLSAVGTVQAVDSSSINPPQPPLTKGGSSSRVMVKWRGWTPEWMKEMVLRKQEILNKHLTALEDTDIGQVKAERLGMIVEQLNKSLWVEYAEPDYEVELLEVPNDPLVEEQWGLEKVRAFEAWGTTRGSSQVDIAIVDSGIDDSHEDLEGKVVKRVNFTWASDVDRDGHGTHVAGIVGA